MAFDPLRSKMVLFGGTAVDRGTWEWDGQYWTQVSDIGPAPRREGAMAWDGASQRLILFGGVTVSVDPGQNPILLGDTWGWDGESWTQFEDTGPAARFGFALASDAARQRIVLFDGNNFGGARFSQGDPLALEDTWEWDGTAWTQQDESGPFARGGHSMTFDIGRERTVLFGGIAIDGTGRSDTWEWSGTAWVRVSEFGPQRRVAAARCFDGSQSILFGGEVDGGTNLADTWSWNGRFWTQRQDIGPSPRSRHTMAFDGMRKKVVLFGGTGPGAAQLGDTWELASSPAP